MKSLLLTNFFVLSFFVSAHGQTTNLNSALKNYQEGKFEEAKTQLSQALEQNKSDPYILYNLGLVEYKLGNVGHSVGLWARALNINPSLKEAKQAVDFAVSNLSPPPEKPEADGVIDLIRLGAVRYVSFHLLSALTLVLLIFFWRRFLYEFKKRQIEAKENSIRSAYSLLTVIVLVLFLSLAFLEALKVYDLTLQKAVVIQKSTVLSGPQSDQVSLFEINAGTEVVIKETQNEWYKISTPHDKLGWVPKNSLYLTTD